MCTNTKQLCFSTQHPWSCYNPYCNLMSWILQGDTFIWQMERLRQGDRLICPMPQLVKDEARFNWDILSLKLLLLTTKHNFLRILFNKITSGSHKSLVIFFKSQGFLQGWFFFKCSKFYFTEWMPNQTTSDCTAYPWWFNYPMSIKHGLLVQILRSFLSMQ